MVSGLNLSCTERKMVIFEVLTSMFSHLRSMELFLREGNDFGDNFSVDINIVDYI